MKKLKDAGTPPMEIEIDGQVYMWVATTEEWDRQRLVHLVKDADFHGSMQLIRMSPKSMSPMLCGARTPKKHGRTASASSRISEVTCKRCRELNGAPPVRVLPKAELL